MKGRFVILTVATVLGAISLAVGQTQDAWPTDVMRNYEPWSLRAEAEYGDIRLSTSSVSFSRLKGQMNLRYETTLGEDAERIISQPTRELRVYRILNAEQFARQNNQPHFFCGSAEWLGMAEAGGSSLLVVLFDMNVYRKEDFRRSGTCAQSVYALRVRRK